jgi:hypothetical protein
VQQAREEELAQHESGQRERSAERSASAPRARRRRERHATAFFNPASAHLRAPKIVMITMMPFTERALSSKCVVAAQGAR